MDRLRTPSPSTALVSSAVVSVVLVAVLSAAAPGGTALVVEDLETGESHLTEPVSDGSTVAIAYTHSVERSRVVETYRVDGSTLVQTQLTFESYGWGLPASANVTIENGTFVHNPSEPIGTHRRLVVSTGRIADHSLLIDGHRYDLVAETNAGDVAIRIERRSHFDFLR